MMPEQRRILRCKFKHHGGNRNYEKEGQAALREPGAVPGEKNCDPQQDQGDKRNPDIPHLHQDNLQCKAICRDIENKGCAPDGADIHQDLKRELDRPGFETAAIQSKGNMDYHPGKEHDNKQPWDHDSSAPGRDEPVWKNLVNKKMDGSEEYALAGCFHIPEFCGFL